MITPTLKIVRLVPSILFRPLTTLLLASLAALALALVISLLFDGQRETAILAYSVPIAIPFVAYLSDRAQHWREIRWFIDAPVVLLALSRAFVTVPFISGHALFLTYSFLTTRTIIARLSALLMLVYVVYLKAFLWQDVTLVGGLAIGLVASALYTRRRISW